MIVVASVQHTGTWFTIDLLKSSKEMVFGEIKDAGIINNYDLVHTHIGVVAPATMPDLDATKHLSHLLLSLLIKEYPTVMPVRDPMRAVITRHSRHPDHSHMHILYGFSYLMSIDPETVHFLPVDSSRGPEGKREMVEDLFNKLDIPVSDATIKYVEEWSSPVYNRVDYTTNKLGGALLKAYEERNWEVIKFLIPEEFAFLEENKEKLKNFMVKLGYANLPWYEL